MELSDGRQRKCHKNQILKSAVSIAPEVTVEPDFSVHMETTPAGEPQDTTSRQESPVPPHPVHDVGNTPTPTPTSTNMYMQPSLPSSSSLPVHNLHNHQYHLLKLTPSIHEIQSIDTNEHGNY